MKKTWHDPVKGQPPNPETLAIEGNWEKFTADMKRMFNSPEPEKKKPTSPSSSPGPVSSS
jgi:hypothetical protein